MNGEKKSFPILKNHNTIGEVLGNVRLNPEEVIAMYKNQTLVLDPAFIKHEDGTIELLEVSLIQVPKKIIFNV